MHASDCCHASSTRAKAAEILNILDSAYSSADLETASVRAASSQNRQKLAGLTKGLP